MVLTPWGRSDEFRERMLVSGPRMSAAETAQNQRERLWGAMVACCAAAGYEATSVADLIGLAGVSRRDFYRRFSGKDDCFLSALDQILDQTRAITQTRMGDAGSWEERTVRSVRAFFELIAAQPAAARLCVVEAYAAGPAAISRVDAAMNDFQWVTQRAFDHLDGYRGMPPEMTRAMLSGLRKTIHTHLHRGTEEELSDLLPQLIRLALAYRPPPRPLRGLGRQRRPQIAAMAGGSTDAVPPTGHFRDDDAGERIVLATMQTVAARGYAGTTITAIAQAASVSLSTFYAHFDGKADALDAAMYSGRSRLIAAALPPFHRARSWPEAMRAAIEATFSFLVADPDFARLMAVEIYTAGAEALERNDRGIEVAARTFEPVRDRASDLPVLAPESIVTMIYAMACDWIAHRGVEHLGDLTALATYLALCPYLGPDEACVVANGGRPSSSRAGR